MEMTFILPCVPTAQQRARHALRNGQPMAYKSAGQKANERTLDALLMQYWYDDRQVVRLICQKAYGETGRWEVCVREMGEA